MTDEPAPSPRRWPRRARRAGLAVVTVMVAWVGLAIHPQPLFAYSLQRSNVVLHARAPLPPQAGPLLDDVVARIARSPIYDAGRTHHVFLCDSPALFAVFALPWHRKVGGVTHVHLGGNAFLRPSSIERGRLIGPSGDDKPGERTLAYFIAHEVTHAMTGDRVGRWGYHGLAAFQTRATRTMSRSRDRRRSISRTGGRRWIAMRRRWTCADRDCTGATS